jgi:hemin uptake protein HemP
MFEPNATPQVVPNASAGVTSASTPAPVRVARTSSGNLFAGRRELVIEHAGQEYHLRLTRNDKLILTK